MSFFHTALVRVTGPQRWKRVLVPGEEGENSRAVAFIRMSLSLASIKAQSHSLLGRLEGMGGVDSRYSREEDKGIAGGEKVG